MKVFSQSEPSSFHWPNDRFKYKLNFPKLRKISKNYRWTIFQQICKLIKQIWLLQRTYGIYCNNVDPASTDLRDKVCQWTALVLWNMDNRNFDLEKFRLNFSTLSIFNYSQESSVIKKTVRTNKKYRGSLNSELIFKARQIHIGSTWTSLNMECSKL